LLNPEKNLFLSTTKDKTEICEILNHLKNLKYEDRPDYEFIYNRIREMRSKELTRIFYQRYSSKILADSSFFFDFMKNNANKLSVYNSNSNSGKLPPNNYAKINTQKNQANISDNYNNISPYHHVSDSVNFKNNNNNSNLRDEFNYFQNYACNNIHGNPLSQSYSNSNAHPKDSEINKLAFPNLGFNCDNYNNNFHNPNLPYYNHTGRNSNVWPHISLFKEKNEIAAYRCNNSFINNNNNNGSQNPCKFDFDNFDDINNNAHGKNTNFSNIDVIKNLYLDQIEIESDKRIKEEELFNLNCLKNNFYANSVANKNSLDANNILSVFAKNNRDKNINSSTNNNNNNNFGVSKLNLKLNSFDENINIPMKVQNQNIIENKFVNFNEAEANDNSPNNNYIYNLNMLEILQNSKADLYNNGISGEINFPYPESDLLQSNQSQTIQRSIIDNNKNNNNNLVRVESNENNLTNIINYESNNKNNNDNNHNCHINKVPSLFRKDDIFPGNDPKLDSNFIPIIYKNNNCENNKNKENKNKDNNNKDLLLKKKQARNSFVTEKKKAEKEKSILYNSEVNNNKNIIKNQTAKKLVESEKSKITPIYKSEFSSVHLNKNNINNNAQVISQEEYDFPQIESSTPQINSNCNNKNINNNNMNTKIDVNNGLVLPNNTNNNINSSNNNQNQILIINQYSKNNNLTQLENDLINYFINCETKNTSNTAANKATANINNPFNKSNNNLNQNIGASQTNPFESSNFDQILAKYLKAILLRKYIQSSMQNILTSYNNNNINNLRNDYLVKMDENLLTKTLLELLSLNNNTNLISNLNSSYGVNNYNNFYNGGSFNNFRDKNSNDTNYKNSHESPVTQIFNKLLEQTFNNINQNSTNKDFKFNHNNDQSSKLFNNNNINNTNNNNFNDLLNFNLNNFFGNNVSQEKFESNFQKNNNNINSNINNNLTDLQCILNQNFFEKHLQGFDRRINLNSIYNQSLNKNISNIENNNISPNELLNEIMIKKKLIESLAIKPNSTWPHETEIWKNNFLNSILKNEENQGFNFLNQVNNFKDTLLSSEIPQIKNLSAITKQNISNLNNHNSNKNNFNINFPNNLDLNLNLDEKSNLILNDLDNFNNNVIIDNNKRSYEEELLLLKQEIELRENNLNINNLIIQPQPQLQQNNFLLNENLNECIYSNNAANDPNYVLLYNLLKDNNIYSNNNINGARNFFNN